ncbi:MAG: hypothetical protein DI563_00045 [Variovorax paradoxus]|uniref:Uncharacterized protein n=1 Tax=Variovorax paradoxus TaxID=34073 RepID=A0A2W5QPW4_VARPD|nr:MAG: hypothetical protein DI563_00045 [Variovorax paradoxus]
MAEQHVAADEHADLRVEPSEVQQIRFVFQRQVLVKLAKATMTVAAREVAAFRSLTRRKS